jgi:hypothetical protein
MINKLEWQVIGAIVLVSLLVIVAKLIEHRGFVRGVADRVNYYEPILREAADAKIVADERADAADKRSIEITAKVENDHAGIEASLTARAGVAESRIAELLRQHAGAAARCGGQVPPVPGGASNSTGPPASDPRDGRLAERVSGVGRQCEHDANELGAWQQWYQQQRAALTSEAP